jgi:hypothetical protein
VQNYRFAPGRNPFFAAATPGTVRIAICSTRKGVGRAQVEHDEERGAGRGPELPRRDVPPITMSAVLIACFGGLLLLCLGTLVGASWTDQVLCARYERVARERRELEEWRLALQEADRHYVWRGDQTSLTAQDHFGVGGQLIAVTSGAPYPQGRQFRQTAVW